MKPFKTVLFVLLSLSLTACGELYYCNNPTRVSLVKQLPCSNCHFKGFIRPNLCPDGTYTHKLQCCARHMGGNIVLLDEHRNTTKNGFAVYDCPSPVIYPHPSNWKTDVSHSCDNC